MDLLKIALLFGVTVVAEFDGSDLMRQLAEKQGSLNEKRSQLERLALELAERERTERIATAEQAAALEKASRKASQPATLLSAMAYRKLAIERVQAEAEMDIVSRRERLAPRSAGHHTVTTANGTPSARLTRLTRRTWSTPSTRSTRSGADS